MFEILTITDPPEITTQPQNVTTRKDSHVTLSCDVKGNPSPSISWIKNTIVIATDKDSRIRLTEQESDYHECEQSRQWRIPMYGKQQPWNC